MRSAPYAKILEQPQLILALPGTYIARTKHGIYYTFPPQKKANQVTCKTPQIPPAGPVFPAPLSRQKPPVILVHKPVASSKTMETHSGAASTLFPLAGYSWMQLERWYVTSAGNKGDGLVYVSSFDRHVARYDENFKWSGTMQRPCTLQA